MYLGPKRGATRGLLSETKQKKTNQPTKKQEIKQEKWQHWEINILSFSDLCLECQCRVFLVSWNGLHWTLGHIYASQWINIRFLVHFTTPSPPYKLWENWKTKSKQTNKQKQNKQTKNPKNTPEMTEQNTLLIWKWDLALYCLVAWRKEESESCQDCPKRKGHRSAVLFWRMDAVRMATSERLLSTCMTFYCTASTSNHNYD